MSIILQNNPSLKTQVASTNLKLNHSDNVNTSLTRTTSSPGNLHRRHEADKENSNHSSIADLNGLGDFCHLARCLSQSIIESPTLSPLILPLKHKTILSQNEISLRLKYSKKKKTKAVDDINVGKRVESDTNLFLLRSQSSIILKAHEEDVDFKADDFKNSNQHTEQVQEFVALDVDMNSQNDNTLIQDNNDTIQNEIVHENTALVIAQSNTQQEELNAKTSLNKVIGLSIASNLGAVLLLLSIYNGFSYKGIWLVAFGYLGYNVLSDLYSSCNHRRQVWMEDGYALPALDVLNAFVTLALMYFKVSGIALPCLFSTLPFFAGLIIHIIYYRSSFKLKIWSFLARSFYVIQTLLIALKVDGVVNWSWGTVLSLSWVFLALLMIYQGRRFLWIVGKITPMSIYDISQDQRKEVMIKMIGFIWHLVYYTETVGACVVLVGIAKANSIVRNIEWLSAASIIAIIINTVLLSYTLLARKHLVTFLVAMNLPDEYYENSVNRKSCRNIEFEIEKKEKYFKIVSSTFFVPLDTKNSEKFNENSNLDTIEPMVESAGEMDSCYICCKNSPDAVLLACGHGGICYDCAISTIKKKDQCCECREKVEKIYKLDLSSKLGDVVKGVEVTKVSVTEA